MIFQPGSGGSVGTDGLSLLDIAAGNNISNITAEKPIKFAIMTFFSGELSQTVFCGEGYPSTYTIIIDGRNASASISGNTLSIHGRSLDWMYAIFG